MLTARVIKLHNLGPLLVFAVLSYGVLFEPQLVMGPDTLHRSMAELGANTGPRYAVTMGQDHSPPEEWQTAGIATRLSGNLLNLIQIATNRHRSFSTHRSTSLNLKITHGNFVLHS